MNKSKAYWKKRADENLKIVDNLCDDHMKRLQTFYYETLKKVDDKIKDIYILMLKNGGAINTTNLYAAGRWIQLKSFLESELQIAGQYQVTQAQKTLEAVYKQVMEKSYIDLDSSLRWGFVNESQMKTAIDSVWSGKHFSTRIWGNTEQLAFNIEKHIKDLVTMGKMPNDIKKQLMNDFNTGFFEADRLVRTESIYQMNQSASMSYQNAGITEYEFLAEIDDRTSNECREHNRKRYLFTQAVVGENMPPLHPMCRSCITPITSLNA